MTPRVLLVALALIIIVPVVGFYVEIAWNSVYSFWGVPSLAPVLVLLVLGAAARLGWFRRVGLTRRELLVVYSIVLVATPLVGHGMLFWMVPKVVHFYYMARAMPEWQLFLPYVPTWFAPSQADAVNGFFEGRASVPWSVWWVPLVAWSSFFLALMGASGSAIALIQRQWVSNERLSFPLAQIPLNLVSSPTNPGQGRAGRLTSSPVFWIGAGLAGLVAFLNTLSYWVPVLPSIPVGPVPLMRWHMVGPAAGLGEIDLVLWPWLIALAFLIPADLSFSCWFFWFVRVGLTVIAIAAGHTPLRPEEWFESSFPAPYSQMGGAMLAIGLGVFWIARAHIGRALRIAFSPPQAGRADAAEPLPYRLALVVFAISVAWSVYFLYLAGCRFVFGFSLVMMIIGFYLVWARLRAETGLGFIAMVFEYQTAMTMPFGSAALRPQEVVSLFSTRWAYFPAESASLDVCPAGTLEAYKIADAADINQRRLTQALAVAFVLSLAFGIWLTLTGIYRYGFMNLAMGGARGETWPSDQPSIDGQRAYQMLASPSPPDYPGLLGVLAGAFVTVVLAAMRLRFPWWPLHPMGYLASLTWGMHWFYMPFLVGWICKVLVLRYGGLRTYRRAAPLATGLIVGDMLNRGIWAVAALLTGGKLGLPPLP